MIDDINQQIEDSIEAKRLIDPNRVAEIAKLLTDTLRNGNKILLAGNGGSAGDAQHIAAELVGRYLLERPGLPAIAFTTNSSTVTAIANDYGYETIFSRQVEAFGKKGDVFIGITTSGNSENLLQALPVCQERGVTTVAFTGKDGGKLGKAVDIHLNVPSKHTPRIQEAHILIGHILCDLVERALFVREAVSSH